MLCQTIMNRLWLKMSLKEAIATPIVYVDSNNNVKFERGFDQVIYLMTCHRHQEVTLPLI